VWVGEGRESGWRGNLFNCLNINLGQDAAVLTGTVLQGNNEKEEEEVNNDIFIDLTPEDLACAKMKDCGLFYMKETEDSWIIFTVQTMNSEV
jgi:hypothetical protein